MDELSYVFQMLEMSSKASLAKDRVCHGMNFLKILRQVPEAAALGLLESSSHLKLEQRICNFTRYVLYLFFIIINIL